LGIALNGKATKKQAPPPERLFDLDGDRSIKTIHQCNKAQPSSTGRMPPKKKKGKELMSPQRRNLARNLLPCWKIKEGRALQLPSGKRNTPPLVMRLTDKHQAQTDGG
jgi:hypothetical protein